MNYSEAKKLTVQEHLHELKSRILKVVGFFLILFCLCYKYSENILDLLLIPLLVNKEIIPDKLIYTGLSEAFVTYLKLSFYSALSLSVPVIFYQLYRFVAPGLNKHEKNLIKILFSAAVFLFWLGALFVFYYVMPKAWQFFLSFENSNLALPLRLEARISEYLNITLQLMLAFGLAFEIPIAIIILSFFNLISVDSFIKYRRFAIVIIFVIAGIITPPDILSQFALAIPMILLYEISILISKYINNRGSNVRH